MTSGAANWWRGRLDRETDCHQIVMHAATRRGSTAGALASSPLDRSRSTAICSPRASNEEVKTCLRRVRGAQCGCRSTRKAGDDEQTNRVPVAPDRLAPHSHHDRVQRARIPNDGSPTVGCHGHPLFAGRSAPGRPADVLRLPSGSGRGRVGVRREGFARRRRRSPRTSRRGLRVDVRRCHVRWCIPAWDWR